MEFFKLFAQRTRFVRVVAARNGRRRRIANVAHAIQSRLGAASAGNEIHRSIGPEFDVGQIKRCAPQKRLHLAAIAGTVRSEMDGENAAVGPIARKERPAILLWKAASRAELHTRR